jgi:hypothetical protein
MDDTSFVLGRQTYAKLSREDLESLGKQAAMAYLSNGCSLNDAVVKLARQRPSISSHQVRRIVEFANQETCSRLFEDGEKNAGHRIIDFPVADPARVLQTLDMQAEPDRVISADSDYHNSPVKTASVVNDLDADIFLAREFGFDVASPGSERTVLTKVAADHRAGEFTTRILSQRVVKHASAADRILSASEEGTSGDPGSILQQNHTPNTAEELTADEAAVKEAMGGPEAVMMNAQPQQHPEVTHRENMRAMERRVELEKKKQELMAMQAKGVEAQGDMGGAPEGQPQQPGMGQPPGGPPPGGAPPAGGSPVQGAPSPITPGAGTPPPQVKQGSVIDLALSYAKMGRVKTAAVVEDLQQGVSISTIRKMAEERPQYPESNPHGNLIRAKEKLAMLRDDAVVARDTNELMLKEAEARLIDLTTQHVLHGGGLGEAAHAMQSVPGNDNVIAPMMAKIAKHLVSKGVDPDMLRVSMIQYEMEKAAQLRHVNPENPIVSTFGAVCKLANAQPILELSLRDVEQNLQRVESTLTEALKTHARSA